MVIKKYFEMVENVLKMFSIEYGKNYFDNKNDVVIHYNRNSDDTLDMCYSYNKNDITIYKEDDILQTLFYMAFRDRTKVNKRVLQNIGIDVDILYETGVAYRKQNIIRNKGLTQGFAEYLVNICINQTQKTINGYFVDLLISIYGEDIIKYPLLNDPLGFYEDQRFFDIIKFCDQLDIFNECKTNISIVKNYRDDFIDILNNEQKDKVQEMYSIFEMTIKDYKKTIVGLFGCLINEYKNCEKVNIRIDDFIEKLESFFKVPEYREAFYYDNGEYSVEEQIINLINNIKRDKNLLEKNPQYIKKSGNN